MIATKAILLCVLAATAAAVAVVVRRDELDARTAAIVLLLLSALFVLRVLGQLVVLRSAPSWLPPMQEWNLMPYHVLLPIQLVFITLMAAIVVTLVREDGPLVEPEPRFGSLLVGLSVVYAGAMAVRYAVRMARRPAERWFGGAIPIVFHGVLAAFLFTWGTYHATA